MATTATTNAMAVVRRTMPINLPRTECRCGKNRARQVDVRLIRDSLRLLRAGRGGRKFGRAIDVEVRGPRVAAAALHAYRYGEQLRTHPQTDTIGRAQGDLEPDTPV